jgi:TonB family protein
VKWSDNFTRPRRSSRWTPLAWAALFSVLGHAAVLAGYARPHLLSSMGLAHSSLQARMLRGSGGEDPLDATLPTPDTPVVSAPLPANLVAGAQASVWRDPAVSTAAPVAVVPAAPRSAMPAASGYRRAGELDSPPAALQSIDIEYPESAGSVEGTVVLRLLISATGSVDEVTVLGARPPGYFEASALTAFGKARFSPGYLLGIPVQSQLFFEVGYTPLNRLGAVSGQNR